MNGIFAIEKPSGITSNQFLQKLKYILSNSKVFSHDIQKAIAEKSLQYVKETGKKPSKRKLRKVSQIKIGHGGTLDPLASGVMVVGIGTGTKKLSEYLSGTIKVYETEALFGVSTTSGDSEGDILTRNSVNHLKSNDLKEVEQKFVGTLKQTPPIYAALKMDGRPLHQYAYEGIPLPRPIEPRQITVYELEIYSDSLSRSHNYQILKPKTQDDNDILKKLNANMMEDKLYYSKEYCNSQNLESEEAEIESSIPLTEEEFQEIETNSDYKAPLLHFRAVVSSGTYIRSLVSDIGKAMRSSAYMVKLIRCQQKNWALDQNNVFRLEHFTKCDEQVWSQVLSRVLKDGSSVNIENEFSKYQKEFEKEKLTKTE